MIYTYIYINTYMEEERLGQLRHRTPRVVGGSPLWDSLLRQPQKLAEDGGAFPAPQFCFKNCTRTCIFVKLFMDPQTLSAPPRAVVVSLLHGSDLSLNLLTAEKVCASFKGFPEGVHPISGLTQLAPQGLSSPLIPKGS